MAYNRKLYKRAAPVAEDPETESPTIDTVTTPRHVHFHDSNNPRSGASTTGTKLF